MLYEGFSSKFVIGIISLAFFNFLFFSFTWKRLKADYGLPCTIDKFLTATSTYIQSNGKISVKDALPKECHKSNIDKESTDMLRKSIEDLLYHCNSRAKIILPKTLGEPILTLFTTWDPNDGKDSVHDNVIVNWSTFMPKINLVLFTNDTNIGNKVKERGWKVFPVVHHAAGGTPVLKTMFNTVMYHFNSTFYGFSNSDILFVDDIMDTLYTAHVQFGETKPIFVTGRRINVPHINLKEAASYDNIRIAAKTRGTLFEIHSADYFISTKSFPWNTVPDLVVGRPAYDNWIIGHARCVGSGVQVLDATDTILAIHQTTKSGNHDGHKHTQSNYNDKLIVSKKLTRDYERGFITCPEWRSYNTLCGDISILHRENLPKYCICNKKKN
ncbi:hypothetical protein KUTeg_013104 [Tegillarca granosa]|uniref:Uncharacterized protein n=1 Tax=Tegillarca granosa TaxID=220873 RepID=A0ABQ9EWT4_TEGGR|nr:hypothetical protein KUTeg_013104 [Tegillarca granosa]